jgi:hypothetical protein
MGEARTVRNVHNPTITKQSSIITHFSTQKMSLKLILTAKSHPWETVYHTVDGKPLYRAEKTEYSSMKGTKTIAVYKIDAGSDEKVDFSQSMWSLLRPQGSHSQDPPLYRIFNLWTQTHRPSNATPQISPLGCAHNQWGRDEGG